MLRGENFAPLGGGMQCGFHTPGQTFQEGNCTVHCKDASCGCMTVPYNVSLTRASFLSPTRIACLSPLSMLKMAILGGLQLAITAFSEGGTG